MKKVLIGDVTGLHKNGQLIAHMPKVAWNYYNVLNKAFDTKIAGGPVYTQIFGNEVVHELPFDCNSKLKRCIIERLIVKLHEVKNTKELLKSNADIIIIQCYSRLLPILLGILFTPKKKQDIYLIQYFSSPQIGSISRYIEKMLMKFVKSKLKAVLCTSERTGEYCNLPYYIIPDYFYIGDFENPPRKYIYDIGMLGYMSPGKDIESVIEAFNDTKYRVIIAGSFSDKQRAEVCKNKVASNITIIDKYLEDDEYDEYLSKVKILLLPYNDTYNTHTSGVALDAIFNYKPVLATNVTAFKFIETYELGILCDKEMFENAAEDIVERYEDYLKNIHNYLITHKKIKADFIKFLMREEE